jgi:hypothetical protein
MIDCVVVRWRSSGVGLQGCAQSRAVVRQKQHCGSHAPGSGSVLFVVVLVVFDNGFFQRGI